MTTVANPAAHGDIAAHGAGEGPGCVGRRCQSTGRTCVVPPDPDGGLDGGVGGADAGTSGGPAAGCDAVRTISCDPSNPATGCVTPLQICDGFNHCGNGFDERDCLYCNDNGACESPGENCARCPKTAAALGVSASRIVSGSGA